MMKEERTPVPQRQKRARENVANGCLFVLAVAAKDFAITVFDGDLLM
jgi:hypothetical protein